MLNFRLGVLLMMVMSALMACADDAEPTPLVACEPGGKSYAAVESGEAVCDVQHVVAPLSPMRVDAKAGIGAIRFPLRITREESRDYCFSDDNAELHRLTLSSRDGAERLRLTAGDACIALSLPVGDYDVWVEHEKVGSIDETPDTIYSRLQEVSGRPTIAFASNACPGCQLGAVPWPCSTNETTVLKLFSCGFAGDFNGATIGGKCSDPSTYDPYSFDPGEPGATTCFLRGSFANADLTQARVEVAGVSSQNALQLDGYFFAARFSPEFFTSRDPSVFVDVSLTATGMFGDAPDMTHWRIHAGGGGDVFNDKYLFQLNHAASFDGAPFIARQFFEPYIRSGSIVDFSRVEIQPLSGDFAGVDFSNSTVRHIKPFTSPRSFRGVSFTNAHIEDSVISASDLSLASFRNATLDNVVFTASDEAIIPATQMAIANATFKNVLFGDKVISSSGLRFDFSGNEVRHSVFDSVQLTNVNLRNVQFTQGTTLNDFRALGSDLSGVTLSVAKLAGVDVSYSTFAPTSVAIDGQGAALTYTNLTARGAYFMGDFSSATFDNALFTDAILDGTFTATHFSKCTMNRSILSCSASGCRGFDGAFFDLKTTLTEAYFVASAENAVFDDVTADKAVFRANMRGARFTNTNLGQARFCLPDSGTPPYYSAMTFSSSTLDEMAIPILGNAVPSGPSNPGPGEEVCQGAIGDVDRDNLGTKGVGRCPSGYPPANGLDCRGSDWEVPNKQNVPLVCCTPKRGDKNCSRAVKGQPCISRCDCASLLCNASACL